MEIFFNNNMSDLTSFFKTTCLLLVVSAVTYSLHVLHKLRMSYEKRLKRAVPSYSRGKLGRQGPVLNGAAS